MMKKRKLEWWPFVLFIGLTVCLMLMWSLRKEGWFLDEVYSYGLSNSTEGPFLTDLHADWGNGTVFDRDELMQYVMVAENERFDYATVYYNQTQDVHPPLYYFFLHTVCSLFPGSFTKWTGIGLNFVFLGCTLAAMYALALELLHDSKKALFACALYVFNRQAVTHFMLIRMYNAADIAYRFAGAAGCKVPSPTKHRKRSGNWCCHISGYDDTVFLCGLCVPAVCSL